MRALSVILFLFLSPALFGQSGFRTIVPREPVVVGDAFQVQFIVEDLPAETLRPPAFTGFRLVSGPAFYKGVVELDGKSMPLTNAVYTLEALKPGRFTIQGATLDLGEKRIRSNAADLWVLSVEEAASRQENVSEYYLRPGEDAAQKIRENLFVKVQVDRRSCYVGQPVQATFKLYSRLQSRSDIIKNPGFYGFSVYDQVNLADKETTVEKINGKLFDVHTIRKVQLFPLQAGTLYIDKMELRNRVEFSRIAVSKKTEQQIVEGMSVFDEQNEKLTDGSEFFESEMSTAAIPITVMPLPSAGRPQDFQGAVGEFNIEAEIDSTDLAKGGRGLLLLRVRGNGNLMQIDAPRPSWPAGLEVFEPGVSDRIDKNSYPLGGERVFRYPFVVTAGKAVQIPSIGFHYFDPDSGSYRYTHSEPAFVSAPRDKAPGEIDSEPGERSSARPFLILGAAVLLGILLAAVYGWRVRKKPLPFPEKADPVSESLSRARLHINGSDRDFYPAIQSALWHFFETRVVLKVFSAKRDSLFTHLKQQDVPGELLQELGAVLDTCEATLFTNASLGIDKAVVFHRTESLLAKLDRLL